jgi:hypothetical protein
MKSQPFNIKNLKQYAVTLPQHFVWRLIVYARLLVDCLCAAPVAKRVCTLYPPVLPAEWVCIWDQ